MSTSAASSPRGAAPPSLLTRVFGDVRTGLGDALEQIVLLDLLLGALLLVRTAIPGVGLPWADTTMLGLVVLSVFRRPTRMTPVTAYVAVGGMLLLTFLVIETHAQGLSPLQRGVRIAALLLFALFIADGRIRVRSLALGLGLGLLVNVPLFYLGLTPDHYGGALTGFVVDKNVAGLYYAALPMIFAALLPRPGHRWLVIVLASAVVGLTGSRTSLAALAAGIAWYVLTPRMPLLGRGALAAAIYAAYDYADSNLARVGIFADRFGSDMLRERIDAASLQKTLEAPWHGHGLGTAFVALEDHSWFFHNSYWALVTEGGWIFLVAMLGAFIGVIFLVRQPGGVRTRPRAAIEAAGLVVLLCAPRLGEVFISIPSFLVLGTAMLLLAEARADAAEEPAPTDARARRAPGPRAS